MTEQRHNRWDRLPSSTTPSSSRPALDADDDRRAMSGRGGGLNARQWDRPQRRMPDPESESATWSRGQRVRERRDFGSEQRRGSSRTQPEEPRRDEPRMDRRDEPRMDRREGPQWGSQSTEASDSSSRGRGGLGRGMSDQRGRGGFHAGEHSRRGGGRFDAMVSADGPNREMRTTSVKRKEQWNFWTLLCGAADSQVVFTDYRGFHTRENQQAYIDRGWMKVPLFQPANDEEIRDRFRAKLQSIAAAVSECEQLSNEKCKLQGHVRVGDLYLFHKYFHFDQRPGPKLEDLNLLLEDPSFQEARERLDRFFRYTDYEQQAIKSTFVTEKFCGSHSTIEAYLSLHDFCLDPEEEMVLTVTLNGERYKFELIYGMDDLRLQKILLFTHKWNLNLVTAKGTNYQGTFKEKADLRLQFDASFLGETDEKVNACLAEEKFSLEALQQLFERFGEHPAPPADAGSPLALSESEGSQRLYRLRLPELAPRLDYLREQYNRKFARRHSRWPLLVLLRQFRFFKLDGNSTNLFVGREGVELRVSAEVDCVLGREELDEPEFVTHLWDICQLTQELVATSLEA